MSIFDSVARQYDRFRPSPAKAVLKRTIELIGKSSPVLDVGAGTGQLTLPLQAAGLDIMAVEPGRDMSRILREKGIQVIEAPFESYEGKGGFGTVISHQAFHWIEPEKGVQRAGQTLKNNGRLILVWDIDRSQQTSFFTATQPLYQKYMPQPEWPSRTPLKDIPALYAGSINSSPLFTTAKTEKLKHSRNYEKAEYIGLLRTFSDHIGLPEEFFIEMEGIIDDFGGRVNRQYISNIIWAARLQEQIPDTP